MVSAEGVFVLVPLLGYLYTMSQSSFTSLIQDFWEVVVGFLSGVALWGIQDYTNRNKTKAETEEILSSKHRTEIEATKQVRDLFQSSFDMLKRQVQDLEGRQKVLFDELHGLKTVSNVQSKYIKLFMNFVEQAQGLSPQAHSTLRDIRDSYLREIASVTASSDTPPLEDS